MLKDLKLLHRKNHHPTENENVPPNQSESRSFSSESTTCRPPLCAIDDPSQISDTFQGEAPCSKIKDQTPHQSKRKSTDSCFSTRTPGKRAVRDSGRTKLGFHQRSESSGVADAENEAIHTVEISNPSFSEITPSKFAQKPPNPGFFFGGRGPGGGVVRGGSCSSSTFSKGTPGSCSSSPNSDSVDVPHFDMKGDPSFWSEHNVQVLIRVRPPSATEKRVSGYSRCLKQESSQRITWIGHPETHFKFDHIACESVDQETLFKMVGLPMVENCLSGYNSCVFAYGQTGSGKTYTMLGDIQDAENIPNETRGMIPRIFEFLFERIKREEQMGMAEKTMYNCTCSFLEIYNEQITDLLDPTSQNLLVREDSKKCVYVDNLSECKVQTVPDILKLLCQGSANRKVAATNMNRESSRSHSVFTCVIQSEWEKDGISNLRFTRLNLVDLAGSERQKTSGAEGDRLREAVNINKSLSTLCHVIMVLEDVAQGKSRHVPYRDSRLTFLLQDSLGGNSKTTIIATISPSSCCAAETLNTLKFAKRAKLIKNNAVVNEDSSGNVPLLQNQIEMLKDEISVLKGQTVARTLTFNSTLDKENESKNICTDEPEIDPVDDYPLSDESKGAVEIRLSSKQFKSIEAVLAGALRREKMSEICIKQHESEIQHLNFLVHQMEEDKRWTEIMMKFREDKIQRMESLLSNLIPPSTYLLEENKALCEEIQLLKTNVERNPEGTRFSSENIRLLDKLKRFDDFYKEGERQILLDEISQLREQMLQKLDRTCLISESDDLDPNELESFQEKPCLVPGGEHTPDLMVEVKKNGGEYLSTRDWDKIIREIDGVLVDRCPRPVKQASNEIDLLSGSIEQSELLGIISEKEIVISDLLQCLENAKKETYDIESLLQSLKESTIGITESFKQECSEKDKKIMLLSSELRGKSSEMVEMEQRLKMQEDEIRNGSMYASDWFQQREKYLRRVKALEVELLQNENAFDEMEKITETLKNELNMEAGKNHHLEEKVIVLREELYRAKFIVEENEAIALEAQKVVQEKNEEIKLLEKSVHELECTIYALENKVCVFQRKVEKQRLLKEELEEELGTIRFQIKDTEISKRILGEEEKKSGDVMGKIQVLEKELETRDLEISRLKAYISELNLHVEAQASEFNNKFKGLEAMIEHSKSEDISLQLHNSNKSVRTRGSGSPFKCIGMGVTHQVKYEKEEDTTMGKQRVEELEAIATSRQKEILVLNARLAAAESMTHDVIRDLLGVKLDMTNYAACLESQSEEPASETRTCVHEVYEKEANDLRCRLDQVIEDRKWLFGDIAQKQDEIENLETSLEKLRQKCNILIVENEIFKKEKKKQKQRAMEVESEIKKFPGYQNQQQRIRRCIDEERGASKREGREMGIKLQRSELMIQRMKNETRQYKNDVAATSSSAHPSETKCPPAKIKHLAK